jgi:hypothetical protein
MTMVLYSLATLALVCWIGGLAANRVGALVHGVLVVALLFTCVGLAQSYRSYTGLTGAVAHATAATRSTDSAAWAGASPTPVITPMHAGLARTAWWRWRAAAALVQPAPAAFLPLDCLAVLIGQYFLARGGQGNTVQVLVAMRAQKNTVAVTTVRARFNERQQFLGCTLGTDTVHRHALLQHGLGRQDRGVMSRRML